jgi:rhodanese-related sulfurtransferase
MNPAVSVSKFNPGNSVQSTSRVRQIIVDLAGVVLLAALSVAAGLARNRVLSRPLPMVYQTPEQRLENNLAQLIAVPPFQSLPVTMIELPEFRSLVQNKGVLILDARSSAFYQLGHVPGALNLARDNFAVDYLRLRSKIGKSSERPIVVYCSGGDCHDSKMVAQALMTLGFSGVEVFRGGWDEWTAAGLPQQRG